MLSDCQFCLWDVCSYSDWEFSAEICNRNHRAIQNAVSSVRAPPTGPSRTQSYRDEKDHPSSRRGGFERPSYERKPERPTYDHGPSMFGGIVPQPQSNTRILEKWNQEGRFTRR